MINLQYLLSEGDVMELMEALSGEEWDVDGNNKDHSDHCENSLDGYIQYFCGSLRKTATPTLKSILKRSCYGDSYQQGWHSMILLSLCALLIDLCS